MGQKNNKLIFYCYLCFRTGYSWVTALLETTNDIVITQDQNKLIALVLLGYSKASDTIDHDVLDSILYHYDFNNAAVSLIMIYITDRPTGLSFGFTSLYHISPNALKYYKAQFYADDS